MDWDVIWQIEGWILAISGSLIAAGIISVVAITLKSIRTFSRIRKFWGQYTKNFKLVSGQKFFAGNQERYIAAGDFKAILSIILTIQNIFKLSKMPHHFSNDIVPDKDLRGNILSVGGPKHNKVTRDILEKYNKVIENFPISFNKNKIIVKWKDKRNQTIISGLEYRQISDKMTDDYGIIIRGINPYDDTQKYISWIIAGSKTDGCQAAADQLSSFVKGAKTRLKKIKKYLVGTDIGVIVVKANYLEGKYTSSSPIFYASYVTKRKRYLFGEKISTWSFDIEQENWGLHEV